MYLNLFKKKKGYNWNSHQFKLFTLLCGVNKILVPMSHNENCNIFLISFFTQNMFLNSVISR